MRLLHSGHARHGKGTAGPHSSANTPGNRGGALRQPLPLHRLRQNLRSGRARGRTRMTATQTGFDVVGTSLTKPDGLPKTTGTARYADDLKLPRMAFCRLLRATRPHARILSIDASRAKEMHGVLAVITGADLPIKYGVLPVGQDEEALCIDKVRYVGDAVAAVGAIDEATAG